MSARRPPADEDAATLRERAEERMRGRGEAAAALPESEARRLLHELQVHQIELEMQNAELQRTRDELEASLRRYTDLYDFAPVGYLTLDGKGSILSCNLSGSDLLGIPRARLLGRSFGASVAHGSRGVLDAFLSRVLGGPGRESCEVVLLGKDGVPRDVILEADAAASGKECRVAVVEVTEQRRAERALRESEAQHADLLDHLPAGVVVHAPDTAIVFSNPEAARLLGLSQGELPGITAADPGWRFLRRDGTPMPPEEFPVNRVTRSGEQVAGQVIGVRQPGGDLVWLLVHAHPRREEDGRLRNAVVVFSEITGRVAVEDALALEKLRLELASQAGNVALWDWDVRSGRVDWSDAAYSMLQLERGEFTPTSDTWAARLHPDDRARVLEALARHFSDDEPYDVDYRIARSDGSWLWWRTAGRSTRDEKGEVVRMLGVCVDVSARREAETLLRESEERFRRAVVDSPVPIMIHDEDDRVLQLSKGWTHFSGYTLEDIPTLADWTERAYGSRTGSKKRYIDELFSIDATVQNGEWIVTAKDGSKRIWEFQTTPLGKTGKGKRVLHSLAVDVTDGRRAAAEILRMNVGLEAAVRERTAQLVEANSELEAFAYSVSHDLRAPLRAISGFSQALVEDCGAVLPAEGEDYVRRIRAGAQRMGTLIDDLLRLSHIGKSDLEPANVDLACHCREIFAELAAAFPARRVEAVAPDRIPVRGDPRLLTVMLENLLGNAWKFTAGTPGARVEVGAEPTPDDRGNFFVKDNGAGFDMAHVDRLFRPFQRLHSAEQYAGTGIGLAMVERIAKRHGGSVRAESVEGAGATFHVSLPAPSEGSP